MGLVTSRKCGRTYEFTIAFQCDLSIIPRSLNASQRILIIDDRREPTHLQIKGQAIGVVGKVPILKIETKFHRGRPNKFPDGINHVGGAVETLAESKFPARVVVGKHLVVLVKKLEVMITGDDLICRSILRQIRNINIEIGTASRKKNKS